jgi:hypothetical protein
VTTAARWAAAVVAARERCEATVRLVARVDEPLECERVVVVAVVDPTECECRLRPTAAPCERADGVTVVSPLSAFLSVPFVTGCAAFVRAGVGAFVVAAGAFGGVAGFPGTGVAGWSGVVLVAGAWAAGEMSFFSSPGAWPLAP